MGELGSESERGHREVGEVAAEVSVDQLVTVGAGAAIIADAAGLTNTVVTQTHEQAAEWLNENTSRGDLVLVKGSRAARMERVIEEFAQRANAEVAR